jgi:hypothetical protein
MKFSVCRLISLTFSFVIDSTLDDRFLFDSTINSGLGERFVDETGGDDDDCTSESFSLSFVNRVMDRFKKLRPEDAGGECVSIFSQLNSVDVLLLAVNVCRNHGNSL